MVVKVKEKIEKTRDVKNMMNLLKKYGKIYAKSRERQQKSI